MADKREFIIAAARKLIMHYGIRKTSIEDIADACGMAKASLYHYFSGKNEICAAVISLENKHLEQKILSDISKETTIKEQLISYIRNRMRHFVELRSRYSYMFKEFYSKRSEVNLIRTNFYEFEGSVISELVAGLPLDTKILQSLIRTLILGYESQIIQGVSIKEIESELSAQIDLLLFTNINNQEE